MSLSIVQRNFVYFGLFLNMLASVRRYGVKVQGIWALNERGSKVRFAWYGGPNVGNIQRTWVYHSGTFSIMFHTILSESTYDNIYLELEIIFFRNIGGKTLARMLVHLSWFISVRMLLKNLKIAHNLLSYYIRIRSKASDSLTQ
jgi:hypothetical protein